MRKGWELKTVADVCRSASSNVSQNTLEENNGDYPIYGASGIIKKVNFYHRDKPYLSIVKDGSGYGRITIMPACTSVIGTLQYIIPNDEIDLNYLYYNLLLIDFKKYVSGAAIPHIYFKDYKTEPFLWMPIEEQKEIVAMIDDAFESIKRAKSNAEQNLKNAKELFDSYLHDLFQNKGEGWEEKKLCEVCDFRPQKKEAKDLLKETDLVSFLPMEDLGVLNRNIIPKKEKQLKEVSGSYTYFAEDDVLLAKITPCFENGKIGIARNLTNGIGFGSSEYIVFRQKGALISDYLYFFLSRKIIREEGRKYMSGAVGHKRVSKDWIENYIIQYPKSKEKQFLLVKKIGNLSNEIIKLEKLYQQKLNDLDELKKSILQKAFNGELKTSKISA
jgi:type I restriction enzyme S subunit